jgi:uncharacterized protein with HEPN domain
VKDDRAYLEHIRDALSDIATYTNVGRGAFFADRMRQDATLRKLQVIGQAVKNLSEDTKSRQPQIPWKQIAGMRDKVIHDYFGVNLEIVWAVVDKDLPKLGIAVAELLASPDR